DYYCAIGHFSGYYIF
nr:immunoglobulin light chain junction region [Macaca mulatta]MOX30647.1 immunoglobulin light chain junction region [Macaca mulatta]